MDNIPDKDMDQPARIKELLDQIATLEDSETRLRKLVEQSLDGIVILDINCSVYDANRKFAENLGYNFEEVHDLHVWDWDKTLPKEEIRVLAQEVNDQEGHKFETVHTRKDGSTFDVELCNSGTYIRGEKLILCICRDITDRKRNEKALQESKELLNTFIDNLQGIAYQIPVADIEAFKPTLFRGAVTKITGYSDSELTKEKKWNDIVHPEDIEYLKTVQKQFTFIPEFSAETEYRIIRKDGDIRWIKDNARVISTQKGDLLHGTIYDITKQEHAEEGKKHLEEQMRHAEKLKSIGTLAGGVAHDFNNILGVIMGYSDLALSKTPENNVVHAHLKHIRKASTRAKDIVQQLLMFSKKVGPKKQLLSISPVIKDALSFLRSTLPTSINIIDNLSISDGMIHADPIQMHQVIINLFVNAAEALEKRIGTITIDGRKEHIVDGSHPSFKNIHEGTYIIVSVTDNGPGISPEIIDRIFDPYFTTRDTSKGSGMGLAVVHGIIDNHGGAIAVSSKPGKGTSFTFALPAAKRKEIKNMAPAEAPTPESTESILFVDDEEDITTLGQIILEEYGFKVQTAVNPVVALELFKSNPKAFDLVITDMTMPSLTGDALFKEIRKVRKDIPVILCTGHSEHINEEEALAMGISAFVNKPMGNNELIRAVRRVLDSVPA
jgi:PAS domain S-box-containing protein